VIRQAYAKVTPVFSVAGEVRGELERDVLRLDVEETTAGLKTLRVRFRGLPPGGAGAKQRYAYLDGAILDFGKTFDVSLGPPGGARTVFEGVISGIEANFDAGAESGVTVFAEDALMKLRLTRRMKTYEQLSDAGIAETIAKEHSLKVEADADGPTYDVVQQWNQSDLAFLRERAQGIQAEVWLLNDTLHFKSRARRSGTEITLVQGGQLLAATLRADLAHQRTKVKVSGYDAKERDAIEEEAGEKAVLAEVTGGRTGPAVLERALGERVSHLVRSVPLADEEARGWAQAEMRRRARAFVTVSGVTRGTPDLVVGSRLTLERVGPPFSGGGYYVTRVHHNYDRTPGHGLRTHFEAERPTVNE
jgi:phage protein D